MSHKTTLTNDLMIRSALKEFLDDRHAKDKKLRIIPELGIQHGNGRIDIAVINGIMHGYEIKSDLDTLKRLPEQIEIFNSVFDKITIVVGKKHLYNAVKIVPDWWGIMVAKINANRSIVFNTIRDAESNENQDSISMSCFLWREEALKILEEKGKAGGLYSKPRNFIYQKLSTILDQKTLGNKIRETIFTREDWRPDAPLVLNGG